MPTAAELVVKVSADTATAERDLRSFSARALGGGMLGTAAGTFAGMLGSQLVGGAIRGVQNLGRAGVAAFGDMVQSGMDFSYAMDQVSAVLGATEEDAQRLTDAAVGLGLNPNLKVSAMEAADAMYTLATQGLTTEDIINGAAEATVLLANSTGGTMTQAAEVATDAMRLWGMESQDLGDAINNVVGVTNASKFNLNDYALALSQAGGVASLSGVGFADFNAAIAATSSYFASGSDAGTSFKTFLQRLQPTTKEATGFFKELGLMTEEGANRFYDASGNLKDFTEIVSIMNDTFGDMTESQKSFYLGQLFGTDAMRTAGAVANMTADEFKSVWEVVNQQTWAMDQAAIRTDNLKSAWETLGDTVNAAKISFGQAMEKPLTSLVRTLTPIIQLAQPVIEWAGEALGTAIQNFIGQYIEPIKARIPAAIEVYYSLTTNSIYGTGVSPWDAFRTAMTVALDTDTISLGPMNINILTGNVTWGGQGAETFAGYAVDSMWDAFKRYFSEGGPGASSGFEVGKAMRERWIKMAHEAGFENMDNFSAVANLAAQNLYKAFDGAMAKMDAKEWLNTTAQKFTEGAKQFFGITPLQPEIAVAPKFTSSPMAMGFDAFIESVTKERTFTVSPTVMVTPKFIEAVGKQSAAEIQTLLDFMHGDGAQAPTIEPLVTVRPRFQLDGADTLQAAIRDTMFIGPGTGAVGGGLNVPVTATVTEPPNWGGFTYAYPVGAQVTSAPEWGDYTNTYSASAKIASEPDWGNYSHEYTATVRIINDPFSGGTGGATPPAAATGNLSTMGGWSLVGERGPELVRLPGASRVYTNRDTEGMMRGPQVVVNAIVNSPMDEESLVRRLKRELRRGY